jgi:hypothetical protein
MIAISPLCHIETGCKDVGSGERSNEAEGSTEENSEMVTRFATISFSRIPLLHGVNSYDNVNLYFKFDN